MNRRCGGLQHKSAGKTSIQSNTVIAALKRGATQDRYLDRLFPQSAKAAPFSKLDPEAEFFSADQDRRFSADS
jgi:hypothetical protein